MSKKLAVITGASKGIGLACANRFLVEGYDVINVSRNKPPNKDIEHIGADFSGADWLGLVKEKLLPHFDRQTSITLVHNAATLEKDCIKSLPVEQLRTVLEVNLIAAAQLNQLCIPHMNAGSSVLYIGSTLSEKAVANTASYVISKHALVGMMKCTVQDLVGEGIHSACICPGFTDTEMLKEHMGSSAGVFESIASTVSFGRLVNPEEIAEVVLFCSSNPCINGAVLHANLGQIER